MSKVYVYFGERKDFKKLLNLSYSLDGLSIIRFFEDTAGFCGLRLSVKLERKLKIFQFDTKRPRKIAYLKKIIDKCKVYTSTQFVILCKESSKTFSPPIKHTYKKMPKGIIKDNQKDFNKGSGYQLGSSKAFCKNCRFTHKKVSGRCPNCSTEGTLIWLPSSVRVPRKTASEKVWKNFYKLFVDKKQ